ncbi:MAG: laminin B domain-containing protein [Pseudomonadota bacterium]
MRNWIIAVVGLLLLLLAFFFWPRIPGYFFPFDDGPDYWRVSVGKNHVDPAYITERGYPGGHLTHMEGAPKPDEMPSVDFILVFDTTGSMKGSIDAMRNATKKLVNDLEKAAPDFRFGLVEFRDVEADGEEGLAKHQLTRDIDGQFKKMSAWKAKGGGKTGPEDVYIALRSALSMWESNTTEGSVRAVAYVTDNSPKQNDQEGNTEETIVERFNDQDIAIYSIVVGNDSQAMEHGRRLASKTGGQLLPAKDAANLPTLLTAAVHSAIEKKNPWYWKSPAVLSGDLAKLYGGDLSFSLKTSQNGKELVTTDDVVIVDTGGSGLVLQLHEPPGTSWSHYSYSLDTNTDWRRYSDREIADESDIKAVLGKVSEIRVRGEWRVGVDEGGFDNFGLLGRGNQLDAAKDIRIIRFHPENHPDLGSEASEIWSGEQVRLEVTLDEPGPRRIQARLSSSISKVGVPLFRTIWDPTLYRSEEIKVHFPQFSSATGEAADSFEAAPGDTISATITDKTSHALVRAVYLSGLEVSGWQHEPKGIPVLDPTIPRYFTAEDGHPSIDVLRSDVISNQVVLRVVNANDDVVGEGSYTFRPEQIKAGSSHVRIPLIEAFPRYRTNPANFYSLNGGRIRIERNDGSIITTSPRMNRFTMIDFMNSRAEYLAQRLFGFNHQKASEETQRDLRETAWGRFFFKGAREIGVNVTNGSETKQVDTTLRLLTRTVDEAGQSRWHIEATQSLQLAPLESHRYESDRNLKLWRSERLADVRELAVVLGDDPFRPLEMGVEEGVVARMDFSADPSDPRLAASQLIRDELTSLENAGMLDPTLDVAAEIFLHNTSPRVRGYAQVREWQNGIDEYEQLQRRLRSQFADADFGRLHKLTSDLLRKDVTVHIGEPKRGPGIRDPNAMEFFPWAVHRDIFLETPDSTAFILSLGAMVAGVAGDAPIPSNEYLEDNPNQTSFQKVHKSQTWQTPEAFLKRQYRLSAEEFEGVNRALQRFNSLDQIRGELLESKAITEASRQKLNDLSKQGKRSALIRGWTMSDFKGSALADGIVVTVEDGRLVVHVTLESKTSTKGAEDKPRQLFQHQDRLRQGFRVLATESNLGALRDLGIPTSTWTLSSGEQRPVIEIPANRVIVRRGVNSRILTLPSGEHAPDAAIGKYSVFNLNDFHEQAVKDLAATLMRAHGKRSARWNDPRLTIDQYIRVHRQMERDGLVKPPRLTDLQIAQKVIIGERWNPQRRQYEQIYVGPLANTNPYVSTESLVRHYVNQFNSQLTSGKRKTKMPKGRSQRVRDMADVNKRYDLDRSNRAKRFDHLLAPDQLTEGEIKWIYAAKTLPPNATPKDVRNAMAFAGQQFDSGLVPVVTDHSVDWVRRKNGINYGTERKPKLMWRNPPMTEAEKAQHRMETRKGRMSFAADMIAAIGRGANEYNRIASTKLKVTVRQRKDSKHAFVVVYPQRNGAYAYADKLTSLQQKYLLIHWIEGSYGWAMRTGSPDWVRHAQADGHTLTWDGTPVR